jgi:hypothetical protein
MNMAVLAFFAAIGCAFVVLVLVGAAWSAISASIYQFSEADDDAED